MTTDPGSDARPREASPAHTWWPVVATALVVMIVIGAALGSASIQPTEPLPPMASMLASAAVALGVLVAGLAVTTTVITRSSHPAALGMVALLVVVASPALDMVLASGDGLPSESAPARSVMGVAAVVAIALLVGWVRPIVRISLAIALTASLVTLSLAVVGVAQGGARVAALGMGLAIAFVASGLALELSGIADRRPLPIGLGLFTMTVGTARFFDVGFRTGDAMLEGATLLTFLATMIGVLAATAEAIEQYQNQSLETRQRALVYQLEVARLTADVHRHEEERHDHRSALLAIEAAAQALRDHRGRPGLAEAVAAEAARLRRVFEQGDHEPCRVEVVGLIRPAVECLEPLTGPIRLNSPMTAVGWAAPDDVAEIVRCLINNAHAHGAAPITVDVAATRRDVVIAVEDTGPGIPPALRHAVFERGVTSDVATHDGLGLYTARRLALAWGGNLAIVDRPGGGMRVELTIPVDEQPQVPELGDDVIDLRDRVAHG